MFYCPLFVINSPNLVWESHLPGPPTAITDLVSDNLTRFFKIPCQTSLPRVSVSIMMAPFKLKLTGSQSQCHDRHCGSPSNSHQRVRFGRR